MVFIPKYRRQALYGSLRKPLGQLFRELARHKECPCEAPIQASKILPIRPIRASASSMANPQIGILPTTTIRSSRQGAPDSSMLFVTAATL